MIGLLIHFTNFGFAKVEKRVMNKAIPSSVEKMWLGHWDTRSPKMQ